MKKLAIALLSLTFISGAFGLPENYDRIGRPQTTDLRVDLEARLQRARIYCSNTDRETHGAIFYFVSNDPQRSPTAGTTFHIGGGVFLTANHVVPHILFHQGVATVTNESGARFQVRLVTTGGGTNGDDWAIFRTVTSSPRESFRYSFSLSNVLIGTQLSSIGFPVICQQVDSRIGQYEVRGSSVQLNWVENTFTKRGLRGATFSWFEGGFSGSPAIHRRMVDGREIDVVVGIWVQTTMIVSGSSSSQRSYYVPLSNLREHLR